MSRNDNGFIPHPNPDAPGPPRPLEPAGTAHDQSDAHLGAVEGDRPSDRPQQGNPNLPALDEDGLPRDKKKICEDVIGANEDHTTG